MLWEIEIRPVANQPDHEGNRVLSSARAQGIRGLTSVCAARSFLVQGDLTEADISRAASDILCDTVVEQFVTRQLPCPPSEKGTQQNSHTNINVLLHPGVTDSVAENAVQILRSQQFDISAVATCRKYWLSGELNTTEINRLASRILANEAIEYAVHGPLQLTDLSMGSEYQFQQKIIDIRTMDDAELARMSTTQQLHLNVTEMRTIRDHYVTLNRNPTEI